MKIAIVHDYIKEYGGAERVLEALHDLWPDAPIFTTVYMPEFLGPHKERFKGWDIRTSFLQQLPFKHKLISFFRIISPLVFKSFNFSEFDVIIVSATGAYFPNTIRVTSNPSTSLRPFEALRSPQALEEASTEYAVQKRPVLVCYCHTPPRYLYGYATARDWQKNIITRIIGGVGNHILRIVDYNASKNVDYYIANSQEVAARIKKFYRRDAKVIYPPVDIQGKTNNYNSSSLSPEGLSLRVEDLKPKTNFLAGGRLARPKHIDLIIEACEKLDIPLKIFGKGFAGYGEQLRAKSKGRSDVIEFVGEVTDEEKWELMRNAKAFIFASEDEDFGITPVEAMAAGTPVIAYRSGGVKETVIEGKTGIFFDELTVESLTKAMKQFSSLTINPDACIKQAGKFSKQRFMRLISSSVDDLSRNR